VPSLIRRSSRRSSAASATAVLTAAVVAALAVATAALGAPARPEAAAKSAPPHLEVHAAEARTLARSARRLPLGGHLQVDGLRLSADGPPEILELERFAVFTPDAHIVVHGEDGDSDMALPDHAWFRGHVAGDPSSLAVLTLPQDGGAARGLVLRGSQAWRLGEEGAEGIESTGKDSAAAPRLVSRRVEAPAESAGAAADGFLCGNEDLPLTPPPSLDFLTSAAAPAQAPAATQTARVAVETDWELYQRFGDTNAATDYITDLFAYSSSIYDAEIQTELRISYLSLWTTSADPWTQSGSLCGLFELGRYWNDNRGAVSRTLTHMMSGKSTGGGVAWVGVLCSSGFTYNHGGACPGLSPQTDNYGGAYGFSGDLDTNFDLDNPQPVWDIIVVSHEIGHNFNSPHSHCYNGLGGSSDPVDECYGAEPGCYSGSTSLPSGCPGAGQGCGTLMSYCHLRSGSYANIALNFGTGHPYGVLPYRVPDRMRAHVEAVSSVSSCLHPLPPCDDLGLDSGTINTTEVYEACADLYAHTSFHVGSSGDVTLRAGGKVILGSGFQVLAGGKLTVE